MVSIYSQITQSSKKDPPSFWMRWSKKLIGILGMGASIATVLGYLQKLPEPSIMLYVIGFASGLFLFFFLNSYYTNAQLTSLQLHFISVERDLLVQFLPANERKQFELTITDFRRITTKYPELYAVTLRNEIRYKLPHLFKE